MDWLGGWLVILVRFLVVCERIWCVVGSIDLV